MECPSGARVKAENSFDWKQAGSKFEYDTQCNGDCSTKKNCKEFHRFRLVLPIKIHDIPVFENV